MQDNRNFGIDIYRILCMFLVIAYHFSDHGITPLLADNPLTFTWVLLASSRFWGGLCNCCFMLVSGYFLSARTAFTWKNIFKLYGQVWFYSFASFAAAVALGTIPFGKRALLEALLPFTFNRYWYFSTYIVVYLFYPFINRMLDTLTQKQHKNLCILSITLFSLFYTVFNAEWIIGIGKNHFPIFIALYFVGAYIRKYGIKIDKKKAASIGILLIFLSVLSLVCMKFVAVILHTDRGITHFVGSTERIFPVLASIFLFLAFERVEVSNSVVRRLVIFITPALFGVYLFHIGDLRIWLFHEVFNNQITYVNGAAFLGQMLLAMIIIFVVGIAVDKIRIALLEKPFMKCMSKIVDRLPMLPG